MSDAGGFEGTGTYGGEVIPVVELKADDGVNGKERFSSMWCGEDAGYEIIVDKAMKETAASDDGGGILSVFGNLLKDYSERRLELGGKYDRFDDTNVTCMAGAVMRTLVDTGTFTENQAVVIGDYSFTDESKPALRDTFDEGMAGTC